MNLCSGVREARRSISLPREREKRGLDSHLNQKGLELAASRVGVSNIGSSHQGGDIGHEVAERCVEHKAVDRLVERLRETECGDDEDASEEGEDGTHTLDDAESVEGRRCYATHGVSGRGMAQRHSLLLNDTKASRTNEGDG